MSNFEIGHRDLANDVTLVSFDGTLDFRSIEKFNGKVDELLEAKKVYWVFDLSKLTYISSSGAGNLVLALDKAAEQDGDVVILSPSSQSMETLKVLGITDIFTFVKTEEEAISALKSE